jgi:hypothetical protein
MNVHVYVIAVVLLGVFLSHCIGKASGTIGLVFALLSVALGIGLAFPLLMAVVKLCAALGLISNACISTDDRTVWSLAFPLIACPIYFVVMLVARLNAASARVGETATPPEEIAK